MNIKLLTRITQLSFYSKDFYRMVYSEWQHRCLAFWGWLTLISVLPSILMIWAIVYNFQLPAQPQSGPSDSLAALARYVIEEIPQIHIHDGEASAVNAHDRTKDILLPGGKQPIVQIKLSDDAVPEDKALLLVFRKHAFYLNTNGNTLAEYRYKKYFLRDTTISSENLLLWINKARSLILWFVIPIIFLPLSTLLSWFLGLLRALILAQVYWYLGVRGEDKKFTSRLGIFRLAVVSGAPALVIELILFLLGIYPSSLLAKLILSVVLPIAYFYFAVKACKGQQLLGRGA